MNAFERLMQPRKKSPTATKRKAAPPDPTSRKKTKTQMFLDLGQQDLGQRTCPDCGFLYVRGVATDDADHSRFCKKTAQGVMLSRWKSERVHLDRPPMRIVELRGDDKPVVVKKLMQIKALMDEALGAIDEAAFLARKHFVYLSNDRVVGCVCAEPIDVAYPYSTASGVVTIDKSRPQPALLGVSHVWVHPSFRRQGVAKTLLDVARAKATYGLVVPRRQLAFSQPTEDGMALGVAYCAPAPMYVYMLQVRSES
ncbi:N-acetyltransferase [Achlya hypogyna]|uniref:N-acetyltransferase n=1 Tax=Achlya hypogyna TaxID=1202772 RepID=A0A1V9YPP7_ACHHY|nr:N-acetyltransferase [Achlya hypogyna]